MSHPLLEQLQSGPTLAYLVAALAIASFLVLRFSRDPNARRRAIVIVGLLAIFALLQFLLAMIPERTAGFVITPSGETVPGLVESMTHRYVNIARLLVGLLAVLMFSTLLVVDFLFVGRLGVEIPAIVRDVAVVGLFFLGALVILSAMTELNLTGVFTYAGLLSIVIGIALQDTLGNVFSGLALQSERSFNVGDWVQFGDREGVVTDINWRATKLRTRANDLVIIPNSVISKDIVVNYSAPSRIHAVLAHIGVHYRHSPAEVIEAIEEASDQTTEILPRPRVDVRTKEFGDFAITYEVKYWIRDYADLEDIANAFMTRIWYAFDRRGIEIPFPIRNVNLREVTPDTERAEAMAKQDRITGQLLRAPLFEALSEDEARSLATRVRLERYFTGETILQQGRPGDSFYIVDQGRVEVVVSRNGRSERVAELGATAYIGEMALMTGAERTATVIALEPTRCIVIDRDAFRDTLAANPGVAERISDTLIQRQQELRETHAALEAAASEAAPEDRRQILTRIWDFFGFRAESS